MIDWKAVAKHFWKGEREMLEAYNGIAAEYAEALDESAKYQRGARIKQNEYVMLLEMLREEERPLLSFAAETIESLIRDNVALEADLYAECMRRQDAELMAQDLQDEIESLNNTHVERESEK